MFATVLDPNNPGSIDLLEKCQFKDKMSVIQMDVTNEEMINKCYERVKNELEIKGHKLWAVVNNAGILAAGHTEWGQFDDYLKTFDVNVFGVVRVTRKFLPLIRPARGRIVIVASLTGRITLDNIGVYSMSKSAIISYSDALRREMRKFKVKVSTIEPGLFKTLQFFTVDTIIENTWNRTDEQIRQIYGQQYIENQLKQLKTHKTLLRGNNNIDIVINDMIDAIVSKNPKRSYKPINTFLLFWIPIFLPVVPQGLIDFVFGLIDRTVPDAMK